MDNPSRIGNVLVRTDGGITTVHSGPNGNWILWVREDGSGELRQRVPSEPNTHVFGDPILLKPTSSKGNKNV